MNLKDLGRHAFAVTNNRRQYDRAVDVAAASATGGGSGGFEDARQSRGHPQRATGILPRLAVKVADRLGFEARHIHSAGRQNGLGVGVIT